MLAPLLLGCASAPKDRSVAECLGNYLPNCPSWPSTAQEQALATELCKKEGGLACFAVRRFARSLAEDLDLIGQGCSDTKACNSSYPYEPEGVHKETSVAYALRSLLSRRGEPASLDEGIRQCFGTKLSDFTYCRFEVEHADILLKTLCKYNVPGSCLAAEAMMNPAALTTLCATPYSDANEKTHHSDTWCTNLIAYKLNAAGTMTEEVKPALEARAKSSRCAAHSGVLSPFGPYASACCKNFPKLCVRKEPSEADLLLVNCTEVGTNCVRDFPKFKKKLQADVSAFCETGVPNELCRSFVQDATVSSKLSCDPKHVPVCVATMIEEVRKAFDGDVHNAHEKAQAWLFWPSLRNYLRKVNISFHRPKELYLPPTDCLNLPPKLSAACPSANALEKKAATVFVSALQACAENQRREIAREGQTTRCSTVSGSQNGEVLRQVQTSGGVMPSRVNYQQCGTENGPAARSDQLCQRCSSGSPITITSCP
jgi:hypothetical protein